MPDDKDWGFATQNDVDSLRVQFNNLLTSASLDKTATDAVKKIRDILRRVLQDDVNKAPKRKQNVADLKKGLASVTKALKALKKDLEAVKKKI
jgi:hypothetical protein